MVSHLAPLSRFSPNYATAINYYLCFIAMQTYKELNIKVIDKSNHWSLLLYHESLAIQRYKPELNHGIKASKELII
jgi:hypothetical protein